MDCPVCLKHFDLNVINAHVNKCLNSQCSQSDHAVDSGSAPQRGTVTRRTSSRQQNEHAQQSQTNTETDKQNRFNLLDKVKSRNCKRSLSEDSDSIENDSDTDFEVQNIGEDHGNKSFEETGLQPKKKIKTKSEDIPKSAKSWGFLMKPSSVTKQEKSPSALHKNKSSPTIRQNSSNHDNQLSKTNSLSPTSSKQSKSKHMQVTTHPQKNSDTDIETQGSTGNYGNTSRKSETKMPSQQVGQRKPLTFNAPLAEQMRPLTLDDYIGQDKAVGKDKLLRSLLESHQVPSMILWGPPGCGKTTLSKIIANNCKNKAGSRFVQLSATTAGISDVKEVIKVAKNELKLFKRRTILFVDEIHRFNKSQQDTFLPHVEDGTITLIGATTENPSFQVNNALLSRCRVIVLEKLCVESILQILQRALPNLCATVVEDIGSISLMPHRSEYSPQIYLEKKSLEMLANLCDGDARAALNGLQNAVQSRVAAYDLSSSDDHYMNHIDQYVVISVDHIKDGLQRSHVQYDKSGEEHYNMISALHKSVRGSDDSAALYWLARMLEGGEEPLYVARRLVRMASEDIGLADPQALQQAVATYQACHFIGMPECEVILAQCTVYLARASKSVEVYNAYSRAKMSIKQHKGALPSVPLHLRNAPTKLMKSLGYSAGYKYNPDYDEPVEQDYMPESLKGTTFFTR